MRSPIRLVLKIWTNFLSQHFKQVVGVTPRQYKGEHEWNDIPCWEDSAGPLYSFLFILLLFGLIGSLYYPNEFRDDPYSNNRAGQQEIVSIKAVKFIHSYLKGGRHRFLNKRRTIAQIYFGTKCESKQFSTNWAMIEADRTNINDVVTKGLDMPKQRK